MLKRTSIRIILSLLFFTLFFSCQKSELSFEGKSKIEKAKSWFKKNFSNTNDYNEEFVDIEFDWAKAKVVSYGKNYNPVIVPIKNTSIKSNYLGLSSLILFPTKDGSFFHRVFTIFPEVAYILTHHGKINKQDFSGVASFWDLKKGFVRGAYAQNGQLVTRLKIIPPSLNSSYTNTPPIITLQNVTVTAKRKSDNAVITFSQEITPVDLLDFFGLGGGNPCEYGGCSGHGLEDLPVEVWDDEDYLYIINGLTNNCLRQLFDQLANGALKDLLIAYTGSEHNITVQNDPDLPSNVTSQTGPGNDNYNIDMRLHESLLLNGSYEAATVTILHEAIHAYFMGSLSSNMNDHTNMLTNYATGMIDKIQSLYPNLSYFDAAAMVYSGFQAYNNFTPEQLTTFNAAKSNFLTAIQQHEAGGPYNGYVTNTNLELINSTYRNGTLGTHFPSGGCP